MQERNSLKGMNKSSPTLYLKLLDFLLPYASACMGECCSHPWTVGDYIALNLKLCDKSIGDEERDYMKSLFGG